MKSDDQSLSEIILWPAEVVRQLAPLFETASPNSIANTPKN